MAERGLRKRLVGTVVGNQMDKTALVLVERLTKHPTYKKYVRRRCKYMAHDENNSCRMGDRVRITESRPISKRKKWKVTEVISRMNGEEQ